MLDGCLLDPFSAPPVSRQPSVAGVATIKRPWSWHRQVLPNLFVALRTAWPYYQDIIIALHLFLPKIANFCYVVCWVFFKLLFIKLHPKHPPQPQPPHTKLASLTTLWWLPDRTLIGYIKQSYNQREDKRIWQIRTCREKALHWLRPGIFLVMLWWGSFYYWPTSSAL